MNTVSFVGVKPKHIMYVHNYNSRKISKLKGEQQEMISLVIPNEFLYCT